MFQFNFFKIKLNQSSEMSLHLKYQKIKSKKVKTKKEWITTYEDLCVKMDIDLSKPTNNKQALQENTSNYPKKNDFKKDSKT